MSGRVFITGGTGFLGAYLVRDLILKGYNVRAIRRNNYLPGFIDRNILEKAEWVEGDILDILSLEDAMTDVDIVIHSAGVVSFVGKDRKKMYQVNVEGTANVVNAALDNNVKRFVHVSSVASIGRTIKGGFVNEDKKWEESSVNTHYSKSKYKGELEVWRGMAEGLSGVIVNPATIIGYGDWNTGSCAIFRNIYKGFNWYPPGLNGFVDVEDASRATIMLMESDITEERFIINGDTWEFRKLMDTIAHGFGRKGPSFAITPFLLRIAWRIEKWRSMFTGSRPLLTKESALVALSRTNFSNEKILKVLPGFSFTPLEESIERACQRYLSAIRK